MSSRGGTPLEDTRSWVACVLRAGLDSAEEVRRQVVEAVRTDHPDEDADATATALTVIAMDGWIGEALTWPDRTDHDRLQEAFATLETRGIAVLQGCEDHWAARDLLRSADAPEGGILWFTPPDVWHAIDAGMLEVNLWHRDTANATPGDPLLTDVLSVLAVAGLEAVFDEGRIEVACSWQRRPPGLE